jgi:hypothetical protein
MLWTESHCHLLIQRTELIVDKHLIHFLLVENQSKEKNQTKQKSNSVNFIYYIHSFKIFLSMNLIFYQNIFMLFLKKTGGHNNLKFTTLLGIPGHSFSLHEYMLRLDPSTTCSCFPIDVKASTVSPMISTIVINTISSPNHVILTCNIKTFTTNTR